MKIQRCCTEDGMRLLFPDQEISLLLQALVALYKEARRRQSIVNPLTTTTSLNNNNFFKNGHNTGNIGISFHLREIPPIYGTHATERP